MIENSENKKILRYSNQKSDILTELSASVSQNQKKSVHWIDEEVNENNRNSSDISRYKRFGSEKKLTAYLNEIPKQGQQMPSKKVEQGQKREQNNSQSERKVRRIGTQKKIQAVVYNEDESKDNGKVTEKEDRIAEKQSDQEQKIIEEIVEQNTKIENENVENIYQVVVHELSPQKSQKQINNEGEKTQTQISSRKELYLQTKIEQTQQKNSRNSSKSESKKSKKSSGKQETNKKGSSISQHNKKPVNFKIKNMVQTKNAYQKDVPPMRKKTISNVRKEPNFSKKQNAPLGDSQLSAIKPLANKIQSEPITPINHKKGMKKEGKGKENEKPKKQNKLENASVHEYITEARKEINYLH